MIGVLVRTPHGDVARRYLMGCLVLVAGVLAEPLGAEATVGGTQLYAWAHKESAGLGQPYFPHSQYSSYNNRRIVVTREARGQYTVMFADHDPFYAYQAQVVAYGSENRRCKFSTRSVPSTRNCAGPTAGSGVAWCTTTHVSCMDPDGEPANSKFVIWFSGRDIDGSPALKGPGAYFETTDGGRAVARAYEQVGASNYRQGSRWQSYNSHYPTALPRIQRLRRGQYRVRIPYMGDYNPGSAQVTAVGGGSAHCSSDSPTRDGSDMVIHITCRAGTSRVNSNYVLNYDQDVTRTNRAHFGARVMAHRPTSNGYTPYRSFNATGSNTVYRLGTGRYLVRHRGVSDQYSSVMVNAWSQDGGYCNVESWYDVGNDLDVIVRCFDPNGRPEDRRFVEAFQGDIVPPF